MRSPFVVGASGHRNLADADLARARKDVAAFFDTIRALLPDTELTVMLGMTPGGDLMIAETALEHGLPVQAVLPMPLAEFVADFDDGSRRMLMKLLAHRDLHCVELAVPMSGANASNAEVHEARYRNLREVLVRKSNLMLALWDGKVSPRPGSTADTVLRCLGVRTDENKHALHLEFTAGHSHANTDSPFVYWMRIAPEGSDERIAARPPSFLTGLGDTIVQFETGLPEALRQRLRDLNEYNRDFQRVAAQGRTPASESLLAGAPGDLRLEDRPRLERIDLEYGRADTLALHYQRRSDGLFGMFGVFAFVIGCIYLIYDKLGENRAFLTAYLMVLLGSVALYRLLYTKVWFVKHLRYRVLAETLRVEFYLCLAGVGQSVDAAEVLALSGIEHFDGFGWIGYVLRSVEPISATPAPAIDPRRSAYVREAWVDNQHRYFGSKVARLEQKSRRVSQGETAVIAVTVLVLLTQLLFARSMHTLYVMRGVPLKNLMMLGAGIMALFLGAWKLHQSKMATRELIWQYKNQLAHFARSSSELERTAAPSRRTELLIELGRRSLMESYLWTIHRYHREHAPPAGG